MSSDSTSIKRNIMQQIQTESQVNNARLLIEKLQQSCFATCVPTPGSSLSSGEQACLKACMDKFMSSWNLVHATYIARLKQEQAGL